MKPAKPSSVAEAIDYVRERDVPEVKVGVFDVDGIFRGKYMARDKFESALEKGFGFCNVVLGWDSNDQLYDNVSVAGWHNGYKDAEVRIVPETLRTIPFEDDIPLFIAEFAGEAEAVCPRGTLRRVLARAADMGFRVSAAAEFEFFVFEETPHSVREKRYRNLKSITPGFFGYSMLRAGVHADFYQELLETCRDMDMEIEGLHTETGPGVLEAALTGRRCPGDGRQGGAVQDVHEDPRPEARLDGDLHGEVVARLAGPVGPSPRLAARPQDRQGRVLRHVASRIAMSDEMRWFVGGQQALMPELLAMVACTVNSYTRLIPGFWAPTDASWGVENRTCALRVIPGSREIAARRVPGRRRRHQPLRRARRSDRLGPLGHREPHRAGRAGRRLVLRPEIPEQPAAAAQPDGSGRPPEGLEGGSLPLRRRLRRPLCGDAGMGGTRVPQGDHGLGDGALLRDHLEPCRSGPPASTLAT